MANVGDNTMQYVISVMAIAVISKVVNNYGWQKGSGSQAMLIRGFLTFFAVAMCYFPVSLMLGGMRMRDKFFQRATP